MKSMIEINLFNFAFHFQLMFLMHDLQVAQVQPVVRHVDVATGLLFPVVRLQLQIQAPKPGIK